MKLRLFISHIPCGGPADPFGSLPGLHSLAPRPRRPPAARQTTSNVRNAGSDDERGILVGNVVETMVVNGG
jgi:hypothetical protein